MKTARDAMVHSGKLNKAALARNWSHDCLKVPFATARNYLTLLTHLWSPESEVCYRRLQVYNQDPETRDVVSTKLLENKVRHLHIIFGILHQDISPVFW